MFLFCFFAFSSFFFLVLLALGWILASEQKEGGKKFPFPCQGESREMTKAIIPPFHHIFSFFPAFSPLGRLKGELRREDSCLTPFVLLTDFPGNPGFLFNGNFDFF